MTLLANSGWGYEGVPDKNEDKYSGEAKQAGLSLYM